MLNSEVSKAAAAVETSLCSHVPQKYKEINDLSASQESKTGLGGGRIHQIHRISSCLKIGRLTEGTWWVGSVL